jgi:hypothetical protein
VIGNDGLGVPSTTSPTSKNILASPRGKSNKLVVRSLIVDEGIVQSLAELVGYGQDIGEDRGIAKYGIGDIGIEPGGEGECLHEDFVSDLVAFEGGMEATNAAIDRLLLGEVAVDSPSKRTQVTDLARRPKSQLINLRVESCKMRPGRPNDRLLAKQRCCVPVIRSEECTMQLKLRSRRVSIGPSPNYRQFP